MHLDGRGMVNLGLCLMESIGKINFWALIISKSEFEVKTKPY